MPHTFPLLSPNLHELLPPLKTLLLKQNAICHIQHTAPAALWLSAQLSCTPPSHTPPLTHKLPQEAPEGADVTSLAGQQQCQQHSAVRGGWHAPAHQLRANPRAPNVLAVLGSLRSLQPEKETFFRTMKSLHHTQLLYSQGKVVWTRPWALPQPLPAMRLVQKSSRPPRKTIYEFSLQKSHVSSYSKTSVLVCKYVIGLLLFRVCVLKGCRFIQSQHYPKNHLVQYSMRQGAQMRSSNILSNPVLKTTSDSASTMPLRSLLQ